MGENMRDESAIQGNKITPALLLENERKMVPLTDLPSPKARNRGKNEGPYLNSDKAG